MRSQLSAVSLFCGCGGLDLGAKRAGFSILKAIDTDSDAIASYSENVGPEATVCSVIDLSLTELPTDLDLLIGGPPCQGFSTAGTKRVDDPRNALWQAFTRVLFHCSPRVFLLENVPLFRSVLPSFLAALARGLPHSYNVDARELNAQYFGVPQRRRRLFVVGVRTDVSDAFSWPIASGTAPGYRSPFPGMISLKQALEDLGPSSPVTDRSATATGADHVYLPFEPRHRAICPHVPNGGSLKDIPPDFLPAPYRGRDRSRDYGWFWFYRKPDPLLPGRTVLATVGPTYATISAPDVFLKRSSGGYQWRPVKREDYTDCNGLYTSPIPPRRLTVRECARLQTFPDSFRFCGDVLARYQQIGNAVPCELAFRLAAAARDTIRHDASTRRSPRSSVQLHLL